MFFLAGGDFLNTRQVRIRCQGGDPTVGSGKSGTFSSTGSVAADGSITGSPNELYLSKILENECSISANCDGKSCKIILFNLVN